MLLELEALPHCDADTEPDKDAKLETLVVGVPEEQNDTLILADDDEEPDTDPD